MKKWFVVLSIRPLSGCMVASSWLCTIVITGLQVYRFSKKDEYMFLGRVTPCLQDITYAAVVTPSELGRRDLWDKNAYTLGVDIQNGFSRWKIDE